MNPSGDFLWVVFLVAAAVVQFSGRGNLWIVLALIGFGLQGFVFTLDMWGVFGYGLPGEMYDFLMLLPLISSALLVIGILVLTRGSLPAARIPAATARGDELNLSTLFTPRNETNSFSRADRLRDEACTRLVAKAGEAGWETIEQRSQAYSPNVWFRIDYSLPSPSTDLSLAAYVTVEIERFDFHRFEHTYRLAVQVGSRKTRIDGLIALDNDTIERIHEHIRDPGKKLKLRNRVRRLPWELWRPANKIKRLRPDWMNIGMPALAIALLAIPFVGPVLTVGVFVWLHLRSRKQQTYVLTSGKPIKDPRTLQWMDSWQASITGLGSLATKVRDGLLSRLRDNAPEDALIEVEKIGYWGTDRWVERDQLVITNRRAIGFVHIVSYGDTLYVAWECHLNSASWVEKKLATGVDRVSGLNVVANGVVAGWHRLNEYDLSDSNFLAEWMHEAVKREVKLRMAEHKIDQEIDFTVQRESRKEALGNPEANDETRRKSRKNVFKRLA